MKWIDLRSDTVTQQPNSMRGAMYDAVVGDDVYEDDPTVAELETLAAEVMGKEAAAFVCSGTMGNQLAIMSHTNRGDQIILGANSHIVIHEVGAAAILSAVNYKAVNNDNDWVYPHDILNSVTPDDIHEPKTGLVCLENALANGTVVSLYNMKKCYQMANELNLPVHLDGARIFNAAEYLGCDVKDIAKHADSVMFCLSKGLCAPMGSMLVGTKEFIKSVKRNRKLLGGGLRQAGFMAACGIISIKEMGKRLHEDHKNARILAKNLSKFENFRVNIDSVQINMIFFDIDIPDFDHLHFKEYLLKNKVKTSGYSNKEGYRFVTHYGIDADDITFVLQTIHNYLYPSGEKAFILD